MRYIYIMQLLYNPDGQQLHALQVYRNATSWITFCIRAHYKKGCDLSGNSALRKTFKPSFRLVAWNHPASYVQRTTGLRVLSLSLMIRATPKVLLVITRTRKWDLQLVQKTANAIGFLGVASSTLLLEGRRERGRTGTLINLRQTILLSARKTTLLVAIGLTLILA